MKLAPLLAGLLLAPAAFAADPSSPKPFKASFIGEGGGYKQPDQATDQYLQGRLGDGSAAPAAYPTPDAAHAPPAASPTPAARPADAPAAPAASRPAPAEAGAGRSVAGRASAAPSPATAAPASGAAANAPRPSLWNGLVQPIEGADADQQRAQADRDYETRVLGMKPGAERPALDRTPDGEDGSGASSPDGSVADPSPSESKVFVSLEVDPREAGTLRDAVAGLGASAGFSADSRFEAMPADGGRMLISGWLPASRLGDALLRPGVKRVQVETRPRPSAPARTDSEFLVGLRVDDPARARASVDAGVASLASSAGFRLTRIVGLETAPDGRAIAVVSGRLPLSRLSRAMALPSVAKILPAGSEPPLPAAPAVPSRGGFLRFAVDRGPWLVILTLLLLLPSLRDPARRLAGAFSPYR